MDIIHLFLSQPQLKNKKNIFVVDNSSADKTVSIIQNLHPNVHIIRSKKNIGFGSAINLGLKKTNTKYALVINPDTFFSNTFFKNLNKSIDKYPNAAILAPIIMDDSKFLTPPSKEFYLEELTVNAFDDNSLTDKKKDFIHGSCFLINQFFFEDNKIFDENIFMFFEDNDLSKTVTKRKLDMVELGNCYIYHQGDKSSTPTSHISAFKNFHYGWSQLYFNSKHNPKWRSIPMNYLLIINYIKRLLIYSILLNNKRIKPSYFRLRGMIAYILGKKSQDIRENISL
ncbi:MAG: glycosyltransferase [Candidatus Pelagibacter sp.]|nr:glycosyltransferase [Candidatus Pelagibacter sp.]